MRPPPPRAYDRGGKLRKNIVSMWTTLAGFVASPHDEMDWLLIDDRLQPPFGHLEGIRLG
jgi:hypothetical protein